MRLTSMIDLPQETAVVPEAKVISLSLITSSVRSLTSSILMPNMCDRKRERRYDSGKDEK